MFSVLLREKHYNIDAYNCDYYEMQMQKYRMRIYLFYVFGHKCDFFFNVVFHSLSIQRNILEYSEYPHTHIIQKLQYFVKLCQTYFFVFSNKRPVSQRTVLVISQKFFYSLSSVIRKEKKKHYQIKVRQNKRAYVPCSKNFKTSPII